MKLFCFPSLPPPPAPACRGGGRSATHAPWKEPLPPPPLFVLVAGVSIQAPVSLACGKLLEPTTLTENVLGLPVLFCFEFLAPPVAVAQSKSSHFMQNYSYPVYLLYSLPFLLRKHFLLVHPGFVFFFNVSRYFQFLAAKLFF